MKKYFLKISTTLFNDKEKNWIRMGYYDKNMIKRKIKEIQSLMTSDTLKEELEKKLILKKNKKNYI